MLTKALSDPFRPENSFFGALFGDGLLVMSKPELLTAHHPSFGLGLCLYSRSDGVVFPGSPKYNAAAFATGPSLDNVSS